MKTAVSRKVKGKLAARMASGDNPAGRIVARKNGAQAMSFSVARDAFDAGPGKQKHLAESLVPVHGLLKKHIPIKGAGGKPLEEYYKWQFVHALIHSGLYAKDYIGVEVYFPKGNAAAAPLKVDAVIFDDASWVAHYNDYWKDASAGGRRVSDLQWLNDHLLAVVEFKRDDKEIEQVFTRQVKPAMREKDPSDAYVLGIYYDYGRLLLFQRRNGKYLRYDEPKNQKGDNSAVGDLSLHLPDPYVYLPSFAELKNRVHRPAKLDRSARGIAELDVITSIATVQLQTALSHVLRELSRVGRFSQRGYQILIDVFALKIYDEKRNERTPGKRLTFYITDTEVGFRKLNETAIQGWVGRMKALWSEAEAQYHKILGGRTLDWKDENDVRAAVAVCQAFQDYSFVRSAQSDLYQLVFYNFATEFKRGENAQFLTPLPLIEFLVGIVNPRDGETVCDPCCGIADFLSLSYVHAQAKDAQWRLDDANIYGVDLDENMVMLATLNMLLNGDGEAKLFQKPDKGSILWKVAASNPPQLVELLPDHHKNGIWDTWPDKTKLMKFDVVLTNPPFGEDRAYRPHNDADRNLIECYSTWALAGGGDNLDLGIVFLENAYRSLNEEGRMGIVVSNSIASINRWQAVREWFMNEMRIVALFDLPANVFAETGVNTSIIVAYKPKAAEMARLQQQGYRVFVRDIQRVGYEKRTSKRNVFFNPVYRIDETSFEIMTDGDGRPVRDEEFTETITEFRRWALGQEATLQKLFLKES